MHDGAAPSAAGAPSAAARRFDRFVLERLVGRSERTMLWLAGDPRRAAPCLLAMPRTQPGDRAALARWRERVERAARLRHPHLAVTVEIGVFEAWPWVAYEAGAGRAAGERAGRDAETPAEAARGVALAAEALAYAHDAGIVHRDLQPGMLWLPEGGRVRVVGVEVALADDELPAAAAALHAHRDAAELDVLALGLVLHRLIAGAPALGEADVGRVIARMPPAGRELVRLPWDVPRPIPEPLRAIVNRATDRQERQRYRSARTLARALDGWLEAEGANGGGPQALLLERVRQVGALPTLPGAARRTAQLAQLEREHTQELADAVIQDPALAFELLRLANSAAVRGAQIAGGAPVLTVRRAIALVGLDGVRQAAGGLRAWPGPLDEGAAVELQGLIARARRAARLAQMLRPPGYDAEVVLLVTLLQNLGRLVVQVHFPDEAQQVRRLMQPAPAMREGELGEPGMSEEAAAFAVLGADFESLGIAVARAWGLDESVQHLMRRLAPTAPVRASADDDSVLRTVASAANDAIDALALPPRRAGAALERIAQRYGRALALQPRDLQAAVQAAAHEDGPVTWARAHTAGEVAP